MSNVKVTNLLHGSSASNNITLASDGTTTIPTVKATTELLVGGVTTTANGGTLQISNGITFPATAVACSNVNTLDDYEEGTWTPALKFGGNSVSMTGGYTGKYVKIGKTVYWSAEIVISAKGSSTGASTITGLPFTCDSGSYYPAPVWAYNMNSLTGAIIARVQSASTTIDIYQYSSAGSANSVADTAYNNDSQLRMIGIYYV